MTYYPDLSPHEYTDRIGLNVGWLDKDHAFVRSLPNPDFLAKLKPMARVRTNEHGTSFDSSVDRFRGYHDCPFCTKRVSGNGSIVVDSQGTVYVAPVLIVHYVETHHYKPPDAFVAAVTRSRFAHEGPVESARPVCPCGRIYQWGPIVCPDKRPGCCVAHYGYLTCHCGMTVRKANAQPI